MDARSNGDVAQLGEHLPCKQEVTSSTLVFSTLPEKGQICTLKTAYKKYDKIFKYLIKTSEVIVINRVM